MFSLTVEITSPEEHIVQVSEILSKASHIYIKDKGTLLWLVSQNETDPCLFNIVECYENKSDLALHTANPFYAELSGLFKKLGVSVSLKFWNGIKGSNFSSNL